MVLLAGILISEKRRPKRSRILRAPQLGCSFFTFKCSSPPEREVDGRSDRDGDFYRSAPEHRIPDNDRRSYNRSCGRYRTPGRVLPCFRRLAGEPRTEVFRPSPNTPSTASLPP